MKIATLLGTSRPGNLTRHALAVVEAKLESQGIKSERFDPASGPLPFPGQEGEFPAQAELQRIIKESDGVIIATPEYHGSFPAMLKLMLENLGFPSVIGGKPIALLGCAAGRIGAIKSLEQLRSVCAHTGAIVLPAPISIAGVNRVFDEAGNCTDDASKTAIESVAVTLLDYLNNHVCPAHTLEKMMREGL